MIEKHTPGLVAELESLAAAPSAPKGPKCGVGAFLTGTDEDTAAALDEALANPAIAAKAIADVLRAHGGPVSSYTVARHRRRGESNGCRCTR
ncbi:hypothetical protein ACIO3O_37320 [Streptomyces sp. NPDC087440]|uniref:hypothetical protein n=1 Tax=Streptomyces sp. NPDC087440 TaxID=3365790 RepID=UPI003827C375